MTEVVLELFIFFFIYFFYIRIQSLLAFSLPTVNLCKSSTVPQHTILVVQVVVTSLILAIREPLTLVTVMHISIGLWSQTN